MGVFVDPFIGHRFLWAGFFQGLRERSQVEEEQGE
jgi:hypothetical protein